MRAFMASCTLLHSLSLPNPNPNPNPVNKIHPRKNQHSSTFPSNPGRRTVLQYLSPIQCTTTTSSSAPQISSHHHEEHDDDDLLGPAPTSTTLNNTQFPIEKRRRSDIVRERNKSKQGDGQLAEPPNFEIGWKRTKEIKLEEKPVGHVIMDFLDKFVGLLDRDFGSTELLAKAGEIVAERAREEAEVLKDQGKVEERMVTELFRVLKLMEMDLAMVKAAVKDETLTQRLEQAKARCRQAILVANSF